MEEDPIAGADVDNSPDESQIEDDDDDMQFVKITDLLQPSADDKQVMCLTGNALVICLT